MAIDLAKTNYTTKADIYSFGMCVLEMFTYKYPYEECTTSYQIFAKQLNNELPAAVELIEFSDAKNLIELCLLPEDKRPIASELEQHPFFISSETGQVPADRGELGNTNDEEKKESANTSPLKVSQELKLSQEQKTTSGEVIDNNKNDFLPHPISFTTDPVGEEGASPGTQVVIPSTIKCKLSDGTCLRYFYKDFPSVPTLKGMITEDLGTDQFKLTYIDCDEDQIIVTNRTTPDELKEYAQQLICILNPPQDS